MTAGADRLMATAEQAWAWVIDHVRWDDDGAAGNWWAVPGENSSTATHRLAGS